MLTHLQHLGQGCILITCFVVWPGSQQSDQLFPRALLQPSLPQKLMQTTGTVHRRPGKECHFCCSHLTETVGSRGRYGIMLKVPAIKVHINNRFSTTFVHSEVNYHQKTLVTWWLCFQRSTPMQKCQAPPSHKTCNLVFGLYMSTSVCTYPNYPIRFFKPWPTLLIKR